MIPKTQIRYRQIAYALSGRKAPARAHLWVLLIDHFQTISRKNADRITIGQYVKVVAFPVVCDLPVIVFGWFFHLVFPLGSAAYDDEKDGNRSVEGVIMKKTYRCPCCQRDFDNWRS